MIRTRLPLLRLLLAAAPAAHAQTNTLSSFNSSAATNFAAPAAPNAWSAGNPGAGSATADIRIRWMPNGFGHTVNNDTGAVFDVNILRLQSLTAGTASLGTSGTGTFNFTGTDPKLVIEGWGSILGATSPVSFQPANLSTATAPLTITGTAHGDINFNGIAGTGTRTVMAGNSGLLNSQIVNYSVASSGGANTNTIVLDSGNLRLGPSTTLSIGLGGVTAIEANGGRLNINTAGSTTAPGFMTATVALNRTLVQTGGSISTAALTGFPNANSAGQYLAYTTALTGNGGFTLSPTLGGSTTAFRAANSYSGATTLAFPSVFGTTGLTSPGSVTLPAVLAIDGVNGGTAASLTGTSAINVRDGNLLVVNNGGASSDRIRDAAPLNFHGAAGAFFTTGAAAHAETMGTLKAGSGTATVTVGNASTTTSINGANISTTFASLDRSAGDGVLFVRGGASGASATTNGLGTSATTPRLLFTAAPATVLYPGAPNIGGGASPSVAVLPAVVGGAIASEAGATTTNGTSFTFGLTTYGANGVRLLTSAEYDNVTGSGTPLALAAAYGNLRLNQSSATAHTTAAGGTQVNSLFINPASGAVTVTGTDPLVFPAQSASLIVVNQGQSSTISAPVSFGEEGIIYAANNASQTSGPNFNGIISGSKGLTVAGPGGITLGAANTITGALTLNSARVGFSAPENIQSFTSIVAGGSASAAVNGAGNGSTPTATRARLQYNGPAGSTVTLTQPVEVRSGLLEFINQQLSSSNNTTVELAGAITGEGGLIVHLGQGGVSGSVLKLSGTGSSYAGQTRILSGSLAITGDAVLGNSPTVDIASAAAIGGLRLDGNWTTSRQVNLSSGGSLSTNGFNAVLDGPVTSSGAASTDTFTKLGAGTLTLNGENPLHMNVRVSGGTLAVNGTVSPTGSVTVDNGAVLQGSGTILKSLTTAAGGTVAPGTGIGTLTIGGNLNFQASGSVYSALSMEVGSPSSADRLRIIGTGTVLTLGSGSPLSGSPTSNTLLNILDLGGTYSIGDVIWLVVNDSPVTGSGASTTAGVFRDAEGVLLDDSLANLIDFGAGYQAVLSYNGDFDAADPRFGDSTTAGNDIALYVVGVPEPGAAALTGLSALTLLRRRRR